MKAPWRIFTELIFRRPIKTAIERPTTAVKLIGYREVEAEVIPPKTVAPSVLLEQDTTVDEQLPKDVPNAVSADVTSLDTAMAELSASAAYAADVSVSETVERSTYTGEAITVVERVADIEAEANRRSGSPIGVPALSTGGLIPSASQGDLPSRHQSSVYEEMMSLDEEIRRLRSELARKLSVQNGHMRKLLDRYGRK